MGAAFLIAFVLAIIVLAVFGAGEHGTDLALRVTARWSFLLFWLAYAGRAMAWLCGPRARTGPFLRFGPTRSCRARPLDHSHRHWTGRCHGLFLGRDILHL